MIKNTIPVFLLSRMGTYEVEIDGAKVKVGVVDNTDVVDRKIDELKSLLKTSQIGVVGVDVKSIRNTESKCVVQMLLLCVGTYCLIIQLCHLDDVPDKLINFLGDDTICFLCTPIEDKVNSFLSDYYDLSCSTGVKVGYFASKILKKANIEKYGLAKLAGEVGMDIKEPIGECPDWSAKLFTQEQIKHAVHNVYTTYVIGKKLVEML